MIVKALQEKEIKEIYYKDMKRDFLAGEIKPLKTILQLRNQGYYETYGIFLEKELCAYLFFVWEKKKIILLDYFAVIPKFRGQGMGGAALKLIKQELKKEGVELILLEIERISLAENEEQKEIRKRRKHFYLQNQCRESGLKSEIFGVGFEILYLLIEQKKVNCKEKGFIKKDCMDRREIEYAYTEIYHRMVKKEYLEKSILINVN